MCEVKACQSESPPSGGVPATGALLQCSGEEGADGREDEGHQGDEVSCCQLQKGTELCLQSGENKSIKDFVFKLTLVLSPTFSCFQCSYTYFKPADRCVEENHDLRWHDAMKRFFKCACGQRAIALDRLPHKHCRYCFTRAVCLPSLL